jgi:putative hemolysin
VAGYVLSALGRLPAVGDTVEVNGYRLTVTEMDARRIARVRVGPVSGDGQADPARMAAEEAGRATPPG